MNFDKVIDNKPIGCLLVFERPGTTPSHQIPVHTCVTQGNVTFGGGLAYEPWHERAPLGDRARGRFRIWLGVDRVTTSGGAMPLPGADAGNATHVMLIASAIAPFTLE
jgi:hypothetical protein